MLSDDFEPTSEEDGGLRENRKFFANIGFAPNDVLDIGVVANSYQGEFGMPPVAISDNTDNFARKPKYVRVEDYDCFSGQVSLEADFPGPLGLRGWLFSNPMDEADGPGVGGLDARGQARDA